MYLLGVLSQTYNYIYWLTPVAYPCVIITDEENMD